MKRILWLLGVDCIPGNGLTPEQAISYAHQRLPSEWDGPEA